MSTIGESAVIDTFMPTSVYQSANHMDGILKVSTSTDSASHRGGGLQVSTSANSANHIGGGLQVFTSTNSANVVGTGRLLPTTFYPHKREV